MDLEKLWNDHLKGKARQIKEEFLSLLKLMQEENVKSVLEIGSWKGGSALGFLKIGCRVVAMDICKHLEILELEKEFPTTFHFMLRDSKEKPGELFAADVGTIDMLYIDGDHSYVGVKSDYDLWKHLVRPGGMIVFHDIKNSALHVKQKCEVPRLWKEVKIKGQKNVEILDKKEERCGLGIVWV